MVCLPMSWSFRPTDAWAAWLAWLAWVELAVSRQRSVVRRAAEWAARVASRLLRVGWVETRESRLQWAGRAAARVASRRRARAAPAALRPPTRAARRVGVAAGFPSRRSRWMARSDGSRSDFRWRCSAVG